MNIVTNEFQTHITQELLNSLPEEVQDQLFDVLSNVEFVKRLISPNRQYAKDRPRDSQGRIIIDLANPHILEDMDYFRPAALAYKNNNGQYTTLRPNGNPNSEYGKWIREEKRRCWEGYVRPSDGEWVTGLLYFYMNYCPIVQSRIREGTRQADRIIDFPEMWEGIYWRFHYMEQARSGGLYNDFLGGNHGAELASRGKAFAYSQEVETPLGRRLWKDIKIGDTLFAPDGTTTKVINIPFDQDYDVYKMTLVDGRTVFTTLEHLWKINKNGENWNKLYSTKDILDNKQIHRFAIECSQGVDYSGQEVPIPPYLLGLMLGDGSFTISKYNQAQFCSLAEDVKTYESILNIKFYQVKTSKETNWLIPYDKFGYKAAQLGLNKVVSNTKFIPDIYKYNTKEVRLNVLKGLLDTDGSVHSSGKPEFYTVSKQLAEDVMWLVRSLGYNCSYWIKHPQYKLKDEIKKGQKCYVVYIHTTDILFNLPRKIRLQQITGIKSNSKLLKTSIKSIEYSHIEKCKCVTVDREDGLFLIGDFIVTHNSKSYSMASILNHNFVLGENSIACKEIRSLVTAYQKEYLTKDGVLNKFISMADFCAEHTQFPRKRLKQSLQEMTWVMGYKDVELDIEKGTKNQVIGVSSKDDESKLRGKRAAFIGVEEFGCHLKGTKVLMYDGSIKNVEDIQMGDTLMGDDNTPRNVQQLYNGTDQLYKITLSNGDFQIVNSHHPVFFKRYNWHNRTYTENLLTAPELMSIKNTSKGYYIPKAIINFQEKAVPINPYFLGLWLGGGDSTRLDIANEDSEVLEWLHNNYDGYIRDLSQSDTCKVFHISKVTHVYNRLFTEYNLYNNKHVPQNYKINSPNIQLGVVAGLIDTDGTYNSSKNFFEITQRYDRKHILEDVKFMCECNGLKCSLSTRIGTSKKRGILHYRLRISGDLSIIPTKTERKKGIKVYSYRSKKCWNDYTFKVEPYGIDEYYGFTVDSNHLFVLGDLTITHNTFPRLIDLYNVMIPSVQEGDIVFGLMYLQGCVCAGTKVWTKQGKLVNIEELKQSDGIIGSNDGVPSLEDITWMQPPTKKECVRVQLEDRFLECSTDHPILVRNLHSHRISTNSNTRDKYYTYDFKPAGLLTPKDYVCISQFQGVFGNINLEDSRLIGLLIGDGTYNFDNSPRFANADLELLEYVKNNYDCVVTRSHITKDSRVYEELRIRKMCPKLREVGIYGQVGQCKRLPVSYQELNRQSAAELLAGLYDTDGSISVKGTSPSIILTQASKQILEEVKILLSKFGVYSRIYVQKARIALNRKDTKDCYNLIISQEESIKNFNASIPLMVKHKIYNMQQALKFFELRKQNRMHRQIRRPYTVIESKVQSIQNIGIQNIYNLTAGNTHTYLANGIITHNTAGDSESDFAGAQEIMYNPKGYNMYALPNVYDKNNQGKKDFVFFFPGYVNRKGCYNKNGVSDVVKAIIQILLNRHKVKYNSTNPNTVITTIAEVPITPAEAIVKISVNMFPVTDLTERLAQLDANPNEYNDAYVGDLVIGRSGEIEYKVTSDNPIRDFPHKDNKMMGALEMFQLPIIDKSTDRPYSNRYLLGCDPYDDDSSDTMSLGSVWVLDLWTDKIVAEYTGRPSTAEEFYEICRRMCLYYNGRMNYENNKKGLFGHFSARNSLYLLTDVLEFLKDKELMKDGTGNKSKGTNASAPINAYARNLLRTWLLRPVVTIQIIDGKQEEVLVPNLYTLRSRALIKELINYNNEGNFDRISAMGMLMLLRQDRMIMYQNNVDPLKMENNKKSYLGNDPFFKNNYDNRFKKQQ